MLLAIQVIVQNKNDIILIHTSPIAWMPWWNNFHNDMNYLIHMATLFVKHWAKDIFLLILLVSTTRLHIFYVVFKRLARLQYYLDYSGNPIKL